VILKISSNNSKGFTPLQIRQGAENRKFVTGFTLLEIVIALSISVIVIVSTLYALNRCQSILQTARDINIASGDLTSVCEQIREEVNTTATVHATTYPLPNINATEQVTITFDITQNPIPVTVAISWTGESQRQRSVSTSMLCMRRQ